MNRGPFLFLGAFFALAVSWFGMVLVPQLQIGRQSQVVADNGSVYPDRRPGLAMQGEEVYRAEGCYYCHTLQVRPRGFGTDIQRGWGGRPAKVESVAEDYLYDHPVMLGSQRIGPDLANIGLRQTNSVWLLTHLYDPQLTSPKSVMPPYRFLFEKRSLSLGAKPSPDALPLDAGAGWEIVPTDDARALVAYLLSLHSDAVLYETPPFPRRTVAPPVAAATNAPAGGATNTPATNAPATNAPPK
jgi:cytochrome c oxidase cbb3-type subunit II